jgi:multiple sugar transport system permease protein
MTSPDTETTQFARGGAAQMVAATRRSGLEGGAVRRTKAVRALRATLGYLVMVGMAIFSLIPFIWMVSTSLKPLSGVFQFPPRLIPDEILWSNYTDIFSAFPFLKFARNTAFIAITVTLGQVLTCSMAAYAFSRMKFKGRDALFLLWLGTMMIPGQVTLISTYILISKIGWIDSYEAMIIPGVLGGVYGTFLIRQSFLTIPQELEDAAVIDGASPIWVFRSVMLPLSKPILATYGVFTFMWTWNDFLWPLLIINSTDKMTLTLGINLMTTTRYGTRWPHLMAGTCLTILPILVLLVFLQRYFVRGITLSGLKV